MNNYEEVIKKTQWHFFHKRARSPFFSQIFIGGTGVQNKDILFDHRLKHMAGFFDNIVADAAEKIELREKVKEYLKEDPEFLIKLMSRAYSDHEKLKKEWGEKEDYSNFDNKELAQSLRKYAQQLLSYGVYVSLPLFAEDYMEELLLEDFGKRFGSDAQKWFGVAVNPIKSPIVLEEEIGLLNIATKKDQEKEITNHAKQFGWMANVGFFEEYYDADYYKKRIGALENIDERLEKIQEERKQHLTEFEELLNKTKDSPYIATLIKTTNEAVFFRSYRTEVYYSSAQYFTSLFQEIAKRLNLKNYEDVLWFYWEEICEMLENNKAADLELIETRKKGYSFITELDGKFVSWDGEEAKKMFEAYESTMKKESNEQTEIKGSAAFMGIVRGEARVVLSVDEIGKVKEGDILVAHATNINYVPALKKAKGIVTEEGGILSHASIISRELRIPCVIGTKVATKILKDGDIVEVDANAGIVRIVK